MRDCCVQIPLLGDVFLIFQQGFPCTDHSTLGETLACSSVLMGLGKIGLDSEGWKGKTCE